MGDDVADGKDRHQAMVARAVEKGDQYYAVRDHSHRLRDHRLEQQAREIERLNERVPLRILRGLEVNIRAGGDLDVADDRLATLDGQRRLRPQLLRHRDPTGRVLAAMENPYVDCIGHHRTGRSGRRKPRRSTSSA